MPVALQARRDRAHRLRAEGPVDADDHEASGAEIVLQVVAQRRHPAATHGDVVARPRPGRRRVDQDAADPRALDVAGVVGRAIAEHVHAVAKMVRGSLERDAGAVVPGGLAVDTILRACDLAAADVRGGQRDRHVVPMPGTVAVIDRLRSGGVRRRVDRREDAAAAAHRPHGVARLRGDGIEGPIHEPRRDLRAGDDPGCPSVLRLPDAVPHRPAVILVRERDVVGIGR